MVGLSSPCPQNSPGNIGVRTMRCETHPGTFQNVTTLVRPTVIQLITPQFNLIRKQILMVYFLINMKILIGQNPGSNTLTTPRPLNSRLVSSFPLSTRQKSVILAKTSRPNHYLRLLSVSPMQASTSHRVIASGSPQLKHTWSRRIAGSLQKRRSQTTLGQTH